MFSILLPGKSFLSYKLLLIHGVLLEFYRSFDCIDNLSLASGELQYSSHYTSLQTFLPGPGESLSSFCCCGRAPSGTTLNKSSLLSPRAFGWLQSNTAPTVEIPVQSAVHHSWSQLLTCIPNSCSSFENQSFVILSPWAILTKSKTYNQEFIGIKSCLNFDINICPLESQSYAFWLWFQLKSSPLLELYTRIFLTLLDCFDIVLQHDICAVKVFEIGLKLKRNIIRKHDYAAMMKQGNGASAVIIIPVQLTCSLLIYHVAAFHLIVSYLVTGHNLPTYYVDRMITCAESTNFNSNQVSLKSLKIIGGGISKIFTAEELQPFIDNSSTQKFKFISYLTQLEAAELNSSNAAFVFGNIPLPLLATKLATTDLRVIAKCHQITVHSKTKLQDIQSILSNHVCHECK